MICYTKQSVSVLRYGRLLFPDFFGQKSTLIIPWEFNSGVDRLVTRGLLLPELL